MCARIAVTLCVSTLMMNTWCHQVILTMQTTVCMDKGLKAAEWAQTLSTAKQIN